MARHGLREDVVIDEVSLVQNYREQFTRIIKKDGYPVLLQKMADKLIELGGTVPPEVKSVKVPAKAEAKPAADGKSPKQAPSKK